MCRVEGQERKAQAFSVPELQPRFPVGGSGSRLSTPLPHLYFLGLKTPPFFYHLTEVVQILALPFTRCPALGQAFIISDPQLPCL